MRKTQHQEEWVAWGESHPGLRRENNEDRILCDTGPGIFAVVDGMGGEPAGEQAAELALSCIRRRLEQKTGTVSRRIREAITAANNEIHSAAQKRREWRGMACVLTVAVVEDGCLHIGHVGDTRLYMIRANQMRKLTSDHSPVGVREEAGELNELEAMRHPRRNEVYRDVGSERHRPDDEDFIDYLQVPFEADSAFLLCSDGLTDMVPSGDILKTVYRHAGDARACAQALVRMANDAGGRDNVSVIVIEGRDFTPAARGIAVAPARQDPAPGAASRRPGLLHLMASPWLVFVYGLLAGLLLAHLASSRLQAPASIQATGPPQAERQRLVLLVDPGRSEYSTIGQALEAARAGDRIEVAPGEYNEMLRLKDGVSIVARAPGEAIIRVAETILPDEAAVTAEAIREARVAGLVIRPAPGVRLPVGIRVTGSYVEISGMEISGATRAGVWIDGASSGILAGNYIHSNPGTGILIGGKAAVRLLANVIQRNGAGSDRRGPGVHITGDAVPEVLRNVISENAGEGIRIATRDRKERYVNNFFTAGGRPNRLGTVGFATSP